jgi:C-terminal processing protease CtpA/Prc
MFWRRKRRERDLERELRSDLQLEAEEQQENGLSAEEARYAERRAFGNPTLVKEDGPAAKAGVHWGDALISVNGTPALGKTGTELELLFSAKAPAPVHLQIERLGSMKTVDFRMEKAEGIARQNGKRFIDGQLVPLWASDQYLHCFLK